MDLCNMTYIQSMMLSQTDKSPVLIQNLLVAYILHFFGFKCDCPPSVPACSLSGFVNDGIHFSKLERYSNQQCIISTG
ncbi:V-set and immunoglobulin domain-containing protein [Trichinella pseudospiralis]